MEIKICLQQIFDIFKDFNTFFSTFPIRNYTDTNNNPNSNSNSPINKSENYSEYINKETIYLNMLKFIQNLKEIDDQNFPEISNENILISNFLDIMFDEVKN